MSKPSAIAASLVNMRNVGSHKSVALTIHVPEEQAHAVIEAFGWPTMVNPVPVAIARLNGPDKEPDKAPAESAKSKAFPAVQQAGIVCKEPAFWAFLCEVFRPFLEHEGPIDEGCAAVLVRRWCRVKSRAEITPGSEAERRWNKLFLNYGQWRHVHEGK